MKFRGDYSDPEQANPTEGWDDNPVRFIPPGNRKEWSPVEQWTNDDWRHWLRQHDGWTTERIDQYLFHDRINYGVGFRRTKTEPFTFFYQPLPAAVPLHASKSPNVLYGGAAGGSKSHSTRWDAYRHLLTIPRYSSLLMRRTHIELQRNHTHKAMAECKMINDFFGDVIFDLTPSQHMLRVPHMGGLMTFGHCQNLGDELAYLGDEYDDFRPDELATFLEPQIIGVAGRLRSTKHGDYGKLRARLIGTTNPGGANTRWIRDWWIDKTVTKDKNPGYHPDEYHFIGAKLYDNPFLMDLDGTYTDYEKRLMAHSPMRRRQLLNGDWDAISGQFFEEWDTKQMVGNLMIPEGCKIEIWIDWGYSPNPGVAHWVACFPNGRLYVFAEWVFNGEGKQLLVAGKVASRIADMTKNEILPATRGRWNKTIGDPSMWAKDGHGGESYEETFRRNGVYMVKADNDRVQGWGRMRHWFSRHPEGGSWLMYSPDCVYGIRTIPSLVHDANDPDDVDTSGDDHAADCFIASTSISTEHGPRPISDVRVNDRVWTRTGLRRVLAVFTIGVRPTVDVTLSTGQTLTGTGNHPVWVEDQGWTPLSGVRDGDTMKTCQTDQAKTTVVSVCTAPSCEVYNLTVDGEEEYFAEGVLVHNCDRYGVMGRPTPTTYRYVPAPTIPDSIRTLVASEFVHKARSFGKVM